MLEDRHRLVPPLEGLSVQVHIPEISETEISETKISEMHGRDGFAVTSSPVPFGNPLPPVPQKFNGLPTIHGKLLDEPNTTESSHVTSSVSEPRETQDRGDLAK